jgi:hypothetical protein
VITGIIVQKKQEKVVKKEQPYTPPNKIFSLTEQKKSPSVFDFPMVVQNHKKSCQKGQ